MAKKEIVSLRTPIFRINFPNLYEPVPNAEGNNPKYGCQAIWDTTNFSPQDKKRWKEIIKALDAACLEKFGVTWAKLPKNVKTGIRSGDEKMDDPVIKDHMHFASLTSAKIRPTVVTAEKIDGKWVRVGPEHGNSDLIYSGCYCIANVNIYTFDKSGGKGVALGLLSLQKIADGPRIEFKRSAEDDFDDDIVDEYGDFEAPGMEDEDDTSFDDDDDL